jgi:A/G-specific adenine glycosylase
LSDFATRLLSWFEDHGRKDLPWQQQRTPYRVWVSEVMLQQTQVQTVVPYFERFMSRFADIASLANAKQDDVLQLWSGLGYYARARNLHKAAQQIHADFAGKFPTDFEDVVRLPGIGRSTAGAILALTMQQRHAILDGNVKRVLARHEAIEGWPGKSTVLARLWDVSERYTPRSRVADYTQAIMDLGATLCTRSRPLCLRCPVSDDCAAYANDSIQQLPGRKPPKPKPLRNTTMVMANVDGQVYLERRPESGIWGGLWSLPELGERTLEDWCNDEFNTQVAGTEPWQVLRHSFSHYDLDIQPLLVRLSGRPVRVADEDAKTWHRMGETLPGGMAAPVKKLIEQLKKNDYVSHC